MTDSAQKERIEKYIDEILDACKNDSHRTEVAVMNLKSLSNAIKEYENAPRYYNSILECETGAISISSKKGFFESNYKFPVIGELEKIYSKKLKQTELQQLAKQLSPAIGVKLNRDTVRSKVSLLQWFSLNWDKIRPKIAELNLDKINFNESKNS